MMIAPTTCRAPRPEPRTTYIGKFRGNGVGERVHQETVGIDFAPHQAFHDAGDPHRRGVEHMMPMVASQKCQRTMLRL